MACTGAEWCDFVSFDPRLPDHMQLFIKRIPADPAHIAALETAVAPQGRGDVRPGYCGARPEAIGLADNQMQQRQIGEAGSDDPRGQEQKSAALARLRSNSGPSPTNSHWQTADWLGCRDDRWRPVEPGSFPLAHGLPARVGRLRGYGNAIVATQAKAFIEAYLEAAA